MACNRTCDSPWSRRSCAGMDGAEGHVRRPFAIELSYRSGVRGTEVARLRGARSEAAEAQLWARRAFWATAVAAIDAVIAVAPPVTQLIEAGSPSDAWVPARDTKPCKGQEYICTYLFPPGQTQMVPGGAATLVLTYTNDSGSNQHPRIGLALDRVAITGPVLIRNASTPRWREVADSKRLTETGGLDVGEYTPTSNSILIIPISANGKFECGKSQVVVTVKAVMKEMSRSSNATIDIMNSCS